MLNFIIFAPLGEGVGFTDGAMTPRNALRPPRISSHRLPLRVRREDRAALCAWSLSLLLGSEK